MITEQQVKEVLNEIESVESEIKEAVEILNRAKKYLCENSLENIDEYYFDKNFAYPINNFKHIEFH